MNTLNSKKGFTLIELLVVISIIGLMSSVVLAAVNSARGKGDVAAGLGFATHNQQAFGADEFAYFDFNESNGNALDRSSNGSAIALGGATRDTADTPSGKGASIDVTASAISSAPLSSGKNLCNNTDPNGCTAVTLSAWVKPTSFPSQAYVFETSYGTRDLGMGFLGANLMCGFASVAGNVAAYNYVNLTGYNLKAGVWQQVVCSINAVTQKVTFFVNGKLMATKSFTLTTAEMTTELSRSINSIGIGTYATGPFNGSIFNFLGKLDDIAIYNVPLFASDVEKLYLAGLPTHPLADAE